MTTPAPCRDCQRLTWCMRGLCPWCEARRKAANVEPVDNGPQYRTKKRGRYSIYEEQQEPPANEVREKQNKISGEGMGIGLADG